jgi:peptidoglycan/LPS O-acetylase OafA/YrhL
LEQSGLPSFCDKRILLPLEPCGFAGEGLWSVLYSAFFQDLPALFDGFGSDYRPFLAEGAFYHRRSHSLEKRGVAVHQLFFLIHNFDKKAVIGINPAFWSIAVEVQLYLMYPLLLGCVRSWGWRSVLWITGLIEITLRVALGMNHFTGSPFLPQWLTTNPLVFWFSWTMGAALADAYIKDEPLPFRDGSKFLWPILMVIAFFFNPLQPLSFPLVAVSTTYAIAYLLSRPAGTIFPARGWGSLAFKSLGGIGIISYSAYLLHLPLFNTVGEKIASRFPGNTDLIFVLCLFSWIPLFGVCYLFYCYVELPSIGWGKRIIQRNRLDVIGLGHVSTVRGEPLVGISSEP